MRRYPEYKNSQLGWVGEIPKHWRVIKFHYLSQESKRKNDDDIDRRMLSLSGYTGIQIKQYEYENKKRSKEESLTYLVVEPNQLVVNPMWQIQRGIGVSYLHGIVSPGYRVYYIDLERLIPQYLHYLMRSDLYVDEYNKHIRGLTTYDRSVKKEDFEEISVLLPSKQEQTQIANFLDQKTGQINELIRIKEQQIELLQEQRTALINQAVTKGLDLHVEMKPSGVEWIEEIPAHWEIKRFGHVSTIYKGGTPRRDVDRYFQGCIPWARPVDITALQGSLYIQDTEIHITEEALNNSAAKLLPSGTVLLTSRATIGETAITTVPMATNQGFANFVCNEELDNVYLSYYLQAIKNILISLGSGSTYLEVTKGTLVSVEVPHPPFSEQTQISNFLNNKTNQIDVLITTEHRKIELLKEYRQSLISEAVTGKIDVRTEA